MPEFVVSEFSLHFIMERNQEFRENLSRPARVWILEDGADIGYVLDYFLNKKGFETWLYQSAESFRQSLASDLPDLFQMGVMLPDGDGMDLCRKPKGDPRC